MQHAAVSHIPYIQHLSSAGKSLSKYLLMEEGIMAKFDNHASVNLGIAFINGYLVVFLSATIELKVIYP